MVRVRCEYSSSRHLCLITAVTLHHRRWIGRSSSPRHQSNEAAHCYWTTVTFLTVGLTAWRISVNTERRCSIPVRFAASFGLSARSSSFVL